MYDTIRMYSLFKEFRNKFFFTLALASFPLRTYYGIQDCQCLNCFTGKWQDNPCHTDS